MSLPLRLYAEPIVKVLFGVCFLLPSTREEELCLVINDNGLIGLVLSAQMDDDALASIVGIDKVSLPKIRIVCPQHTQKSLQQEIFIHIENMKNVSKEKVQLYFRDHIKSQQNYPNASCLQIPRVIVESIDRYYARQVMEPSIVGASQ